MVRRLAPGLVALILLTSNSAGATTAPALSGRITIDGILADYAADEWILDDSAAFPERANDSRWGIDNDVARVALTWDHARLYIAVDAALASSGLLVAIAGGPGGVGSLDATGEFRRAIDIPFPANLLILAMPGSEPRAARSDALHAFAPVDRAIVPAAIRIAAGGRTGFEAAVPWTLLDAARPVRVLVAVTDGIGTGSGDAAPDSRAVLSGDRRARAVLDRWVSVTADADADGSADEGVSPREVVRVEPGTEPAAGGRSVEIEATADRGAFAPDRGESVVLTLRSPAGVFDRFEGRCVIHAMDGRRVRALDMPPVSAAAGVSVVWDGRDEAGLVCDGAVYIAAFDVEATVAGSRGRAVARVGVAVVR